MAGGLVRKVNQPDLRSLRVKLLAKPIFPLEGPDALAGWTGEHDVLGPLQDRIERGRLRTAQAEQLNGNSDEVMIRRFVEGHI
jgi:hypothetical protein